MELSSLYFKGSVLQKIGFILANGAGPDEMPSYVTFDLGLHCLIKYLPWNPMG